jgi:hypothetical protein
MNKRYACEDFDTVPGVPGTHYCPGCNRTPDDYAIPSVGCPCDTHGGGGGSLTAIEVVRYLDETERRAMNLDTLDPARGLRQLARMFKCDPALRTR